MRALLFVLFLTACATPETAQQAVFQTKSGYEVALTAAVAYKRLPPCEKAAQPCSDKSVVAQLQKADKVAYDALRAAESAVRTPALGQGSANAAVTAARAALDAFVSITTSLGVK
jgi:hypothetical protein